MSKLISLFDVGALADQLAKGQLVLTPNQRLASRIQVAYAIHCQTLGQRVLDAPNVYSLNSWIARNWETLLLKASPCVMDCRLLSAVQEHAIWEQIVEQSLLGSALLRPAATAQQAMSAYHTMINWRQDISNAALRASFESDEDCGAFLQWADKFESWCTDHQYLPAVRQAQRLIKAFALNELEALTSIITVGFDDIPPLHRDLIDCAGTFTPIELGDAASSVELVACENSQQELLSSAVWAKKILREQPDATVALVIPDLAQQRQGVQRVLQEVFEPGFNLPGQVRRNLPFNFSAGYPLAEAPVIRAAINALSLCSQSFDIPTLTSLCQSPFYCLGENDSQLISRLITLLYNERDYSISPARFRQLALKAGGFQRESETDSSVQAQGWHFAKALQDFATSVRAASINKTRTPSQWLPFIQQLLGIIGWPGVRSLDSIEYQQVTQWQQALEQLGTLGDVIKASNFAQTLASLRGILSRHIFQPQTADSPLQVLGTLEAAGLEFSHIWLQSMSSQQWPPQPGPSALLPFHLQREQKMPHATAERELEYAQGLSQRFIHSTKTLVVSYPLIIDENPAEVSALFAQYPLTTIKQLLGRELDSLTPLLEIRRRHIESVTLQDYKPGNAPSLKTDELVSGGSALFASQSACPFRAFVQHRLGLRALASAALGLDAAERGSLLHRALELIWEKLKSQQTLNEQSESALQKLCAEAADYALSELGQRRGKPLGARYCSLESQRLQKLLHAWLQVEKQRASFVVESIEAQQSFRFAELSLQTRIDRIDRLTDDSLMIIDYKTGKSSINRWWGERPDEPQLPLYCLLSDNALNNDETLTGDDSVGAIAFAQIRVDGCTLKGVGSQELPETQVQWKDKIKTEAGVESWQQLKLRWQKVLTALAQDFIAGNSAVDPKARPQTCQYCDLASVCRVNHQQLPS